MITIAVDAMGGDLAPRPEVEGSILAARELGVRVLLVGIPAEIKRELGKHSNRGLSIEIVPASEVIAMSDSPAHAFRRKKDSSAHVAARLVRQGQADALVSAGNTGALMTVARFVLGTLPSVQRPALAAPFPTSRGGVTVLIDAGANVDSKVTHLLQFAVMGEIYYRVIFGTRRPKVALLSIGEEESKGNELTREAHNRLKDLPLNFVGNIEGRGGFLRERRRDRTRWLHRKCGLEDQRGIGPACRGAEEVAQKHDRIAGRILRAHEALIRVSPAN
jgi:glycerol-3-phosphate acyltransferase PlsX